MGREAQRQGMSPAVGQVAGTWWWHLCGVSRTGLPSSISLVSLWQGLRSRMLPSDRRAPGDGYSSVLRVGQLFLN